MFCGNLEKYKAKRKVLIKNGYPFRSREYGRSAVIEAFGRKFRYTDNKDQGLMRICGRVSQNAAKYIVKHGLVDIQAHAIDDYHIDNLRANTPGWCWAFDLDACYWNIAYRKGYITKKTFEAGLTNKDNRLIALGSLNKTFHDEQWDEGKKLMSETTKANTAAIWNNIIAEVSDLYYAFVKEIGIENYYMWRTDCAYFSPKVIYKAKEFFDRRGFEYKVARCFFEQYEGQRLHIKLIPTWQPDAIERVYVIPEYHEREEKVKNI